MYSGGSGGGKTNLAARNFRKFCVSFLFLFSTGDFDMMNTRLALLAAVAAAGLFRNAEVGADGSGEQAVAGEQPTEQAAVPPGSASVIDVKFNFKSRAIKDDNGKEIARTKKHPSIVLSMPVPTDEELIGYLSQPESAVARLIRNAAHGIIADAVRQQFDEQIEAIGENSDKELSVNDLDFSKLSLEYIASLPPSQRGGVALTEEDFNAFFADYMQVMVVATGKDEKKIGAAIDLYKKPTKVRSNKPILGVLMEQLDVYLASSPNLEDTGEVATRLRTKFEKWYNEPEKTIDLDAL